MLTLFFFNKKTEQGGTIVGGARHSSTTEDDVVKIAKMKVRAVQRNKGITQERLAGNLPGWFLGSTAPQTPSHTPPIYPLKSMSSCRSLLSTGDGGAFTKTLFSRSQSNNKMSVDQRVASRKDLWSEVRQAPALKRHCEQTELYDFIAGLSSTVIRGNIAQQRQLGEALQREEVWSFPFQYCTHKTQCTVSSQTLVVFLTKKKN